MCDESVLVVVAVAVVVVVVRGAKRWTPVPGEPERFTSLREGLPVESQRFLGPDESDLHEKRTG